MDVETAELQGIVERLVNRGTGEIDLTDPSLTKEMMDFFRKQPEGESFNPRKHIKKEEKTKKRNARVKGQPSHSSSDSYENDFLENTEPLNLRPGARPEYDPNGKSSEFVNPEKDDPIKYVDEIDDSQDTDGCETSAEEAMMEKLSNLCLENKQTVLDKERAGELHEIEQVLRSMPDVTLRIWDESWRSLFVHTNKSEFVTEEDIEGLLHTFF